MYGTHTDVWAMSFRNAWERIIPPKGSQIYVTLTFVHRF